MSVNETSPFSQVWERIAYFGLISPKNSSKKRVLTLISLIAANLEVKNFFNSSECKHNGTLNQIKEIDSVRDYSLADEVNASACRATSVSASKSMGWSVLTIL